MERVGFCRLCGAVGAGMYSIPCGDVYCASCLAGWTRAHFHVPQQLPLRCCKRRVPFASLSEVLEPEELVYYQFLVRKQVEKMRLETQHPPTNRTPAWLYWLCDDCSGPIFSSAAEPMDSRLLDCGHVLCPTCQKTREKSARLCCEPLRQLLKLAKEGRTTTKSLINGDTDTDSDPPHPRVPARAPKVTATKNGKVKRKATKVSPNAVVDVSGSGDEDAIEKCFICSTEVQLSTTRFRADCGHIYCRGCLQERSQRAIKNDEQGSIGFPLHCCGKLIGLNIVKPALTRRAAVKYEALFNKNHEESVKLLRGARTAIKRKAAAETRSTNKKPRLNGDQMDEVDEEIPDCVACMDPVTDKTHRLRGPCGHVYCMTCLQMMATKSLSDRTLIPIRCCSMEFPVEFVERVLTQRNWAQYRRFLEEKDWKTSDLKSDQDYAKMIKKIGGKQCPTCGIGVQKVSGCNHMACTRGHHFCWQCLQPACVCGRLTSYS